MSFSPNHEELRDLQQQLHRARTVTPGLIAEVIARACFRFPAHPSATKARVIRLIESSAFCDAALALLALELPQWRLRRLVYESGEWICSLSRELELPAELDEMAEAHHESLPLAILNAFVEARVTASLGTKAGQSPYRRFVQYGGTPFAATISHDPTITGRTCDGPNHRSTIEVEQWARASAIHHRRRDCGPGCGGIGLRWAGCSSAVDGSRPRLAISARRRTMPNAQRRPSTGGL